MKKRFIPILALFLAPASAEPQRPRPEPDVEIRIKAAMQFRYTASFAPDAPSPSDDPAIGFHYRRLRPKLEAKAFEGRLAGVLQAETRSGDPVLLDAWIDYTPDSSLRLRLGRFTPAFFREAMVSNTRQQAVDRTSIGNNINPNTNDRVQGLEIRHTRDLCRVYLTLSEGVGLPITEFNDETADWGLTLRVEHLLIGDSFSPFNQYTAPRETPRGLLLGAAAHAQHLRGMGERDAWTADLSYQDSGFNAMLMAAGHVAEDRNRGPTPEPESIYGLAAHAGVYITDTVEPFARYEWATTSDSEHPDLHLITVGVNWYIYAQALKFTADFNLALDGVGPALDRGTDGLMQTPGDENRYYARAQIQVLF